MQALGCMPSSVFYVFPIFIQHLRTDTPLHVLEHLL